MKKVILIISLFLASAVMYGQEFIAYRDSVENGYNFWLSVPEGYDTLKVDIPVVIFGIIYGIYALVLNGNPQMLVNNPKLTKVLVPKFILLAMIPNLFILRYYLLKLKFDKTGRGIIIACFVCAIVFLAAQFLL